MKFSTTYQITAAQITAQYRLTIDGLLTFHENTIARYLTTLGLAAFDVQKKDMTWVSEMGALRVWFDFEAREVHSGKVTARGNSCWSMISMSERKLLSCEGLIPESELVKELLS